MFTAQNPYRLFLMAVAVTALSAGCSGEGSGEGGGAPVREVETVVVQPRSWRMVSELPGRIEPVRVAEVRARVAGIVLERCFEEGADVTADQVLFRIDPAPFRAALSRAQGELAKAEAVLFEAQAVLKRYTPLVKLDAVSRQDFDTAQAAAQTAEAAKRSAQADVETAQLNLDYTTVRAPISGRIGRAKVTEGALVGKDEATAMATIQQLDPVYVDFTQPVADALRLRDALTQGQMTQDQADVAQISVTVEGTQRIRQGRLLFSDIEVDRGTGQVSLRGELPNSDALLLPGMYVRVSVTQGVDPQAILLPQRAVRYAADGSRLVLVVDNDSVARLRPIGTGRMDGGFWQIVDGLREGERVIVGGSVQPDETVRFSDMADGSAGEQPAAGTRE